MLSDVSDVENSTGHLLRALGIEVVTVEVVNS